ncbi:Glycosyl hydrolase family 63 C-terminal domain-containing protein [Kaistella antarctica]|uniref:Glucosidase n=2 Tax=Kaistella antarctica TaxID=266748 RepID=A0A448NS27_9FLAO|nr:glucosidase [Kaistella antarctica]KEY18657.1 glucosidase [Kaistella antarctica]SEW16983.1 Glycosyl hydrolase family 63 C-terminal domain-containing protein [Kaistella antarctica]VEH99756.1 Mannosyl oligosaccharide glucosidase [Kaistella antarctica]
MTEKERMLDDRWRKWGPYVSNRQWGTVREDYSSTGNAWGFTTYNDAISRTYRWSEDGIAGICDAKQRLCFAFSFWNRKDKMIKERFFGLSNYEGNHGEDLKEIYYYLDNTPTHSYMKMVYKYPISEFPYDELIAENKRRSKQEPEFELVDTGIFNDNNYFDIFIEYAKINHDDFLIRVTVKNRSEQKAPLVIMPTLWFRNNWSWGYGNYIPQLRSSKNGLIDIDHESLPLNKLYARDQNTRAVFCNNESNPVKISDSNSEAQFFKDGINDFLIHNDEAAINPEQSGTKASFLIEAEIEASESQSFDFRLSPHDMDDAFFDFDEIFSKRRNEANDFYGGIQKEIEDEEEKNIQRQAFAGLLWNKQFYHYNVSKWLKGDPKLDAPRDFDKFVRNTEWEHMQNKDIISMPDKWEYPWFATWDLAFHCVPFAILDSGFAKQQLKLLTKEWFIHPNGQLPAYEWDFSDVNPPVHAWSTFRVFKIDEMINGKPDIPFLESVFQKLLLNFTWWVNRKDKKGNNIFGGGFLGLDNIGAFDRNMEFKNGGHLEQADGTSWMAMFALNMMRISMELALYNPIYEDMAIKFFEHYLYIAEAMENIGETKDGLWNEEDGFFYDLLQLDNGDSIPLKLRSIVGLIPLFAVEIVEHSLLEKLPNFRARMDWILTHKPELVDLVSHWEVEGKGGKHLMSILRKTRLKRVLSRMVDEDEFLSPYGIRSMSKVYEKEPYKFSVDGKNFTVKYTAAESDSSMFGGNSNWRGPIWFPINFLIVESLQRFHYYYGDSLQIEYPANSSEMRNLDFVADDLSKRLYSIFRKDEDGNRAFNGKNDLLNHNEFFKNYIMFYEYFNGDTGQGIGASHQTGWTATIAKLIQPRMGSRPR